MPTVSPEFSTGQPVANKKTGVVSWVLIAGDNYMTIQGSNSRRVRVSTANYEPAGHDVSWSSAPSTSYGVAQGGWSA